MPLCLARRTNRGDGGLLFGTADGAFGEAGGEVGVPDLLEGHGTGGERLLEEVYGAVQLGGGGKLGRGAEGESGIIDAHAEGRGERREVVLDDGEAAVVGVSWVGGVEGPDDAGGLDDSIPADTIIEIGEEVVPSGEVAALRKDRYEGISP